MLLNTKLKVGFKSTKANLKSKEVLEKISGGRGGGSIVLVDENGRIT